MTSSRPNFLDSEYFVDEPGNWHIKKGAPQEVINEFNEFMQGDEADNVEPVQKIKE